MEKLTLKQEKFSQIYVEVGNASEAYRQAYNTARMKPATVNRKAFHMIEQGKIRARIETLQAEHRTRHDVTVDSLTADARDAIELAKETGRASAYVSALGLIAKLHGLLTDKVESKMQLSGDMTTDKAMNILRSAGIDPELITPKRGNRERIS